MEWREREFRPNEAEAEAEKENARGREPKKYNEEVIIESDKYG